ncbi:hypothetical protein DQ04_06591010 [Trypanosoma grayi]|uniref:hypothetical protein n=1 Tax=Trypanosoma grayi TaxID=71804 RepID=UPI0004F42BC8|nr:hypothetical protein DQ04_06591010 [Trypanosoma grayi]KEG08713.1 hypothetical protein DQ04_06591010 [Trypanosoma grayi]
MANGQQRAQADTPPPHSDFQPRDAADGGSVCDAEAWTMESIRRLLRRRLAVRLSGELRRFSWDPYATSVLDEDVDRVKSWYMRTTVSRSPAYLTQWHQQLQEQQRLLHYQYPQDHHHHHHHHHHHGRGGASYSHPRHYLPYYYYRHNHHKNDAYAQQQQQQQQRQQHYRDQQYYQYQQSLEPNHQGDFLIHQQDQYQHR